MRRLAAALALVLFFAPPARTEDPSPDEQPSRTTQKHIDRTQKLRGLEFKKAPRVQFWDADKLKKLMVEDFEKELPDDKAEKLTTTMAAFGLVPKDYALKKEILELMLEQIAGFYHPEKKILCLIEGKSGAGMEQDIVTIHELNHAMQDQHFDLTRLTNLTLANDDMATAFKALVEGEATMVMFDHVLEQQGGMTCDQVPGIEGLIEAQMKGGGAAAGGEKLARAPLAIRESLVGAYIDGFKWCVALKRDGGWDAINATWTDIPVSMEQILHPEKYLERDMPQTVTLPKTFGAYEGWETVSENTHGEFSVRMILLTLKPKSPKSGAEAAAGWDGDSYRVLRKDGTVVTAWATVWDTETDAREFASAYSKVLREKHEELKDTKSSSTSYSHGFGGEWVELRREGRNVFVVEGGPEDAAKATVDAMIDGTTFEELKPGVGAK
ncbi:MAG: hypothetical protein HUU15_18290 [Candidatus Brocadiae bacterium]|nr:hypothetical protein [Candidatus Brocadiia bacterium]